MANIYELTKGLSQEDAAIFSALAEAGWTIELQAHKYVWRNYDTHEAVDPIDNDAEAVHAARVLYGTIQKEPASKNQSGKQNEQAPAEETQAAGPDEAEGNTDEQRDISEFIAQPMHPLPDLLPRFHASEAVLTHQMDPKRLSTHPLLLMRAEGLNEEHVEDLKEAFLAGRYVPPADAFFDGERYWLAEGNHRHAGALRAGKFLGVNVRNGTLQDAFLFALKSNADHGLKLTNDDKRFKAVALLADPERFKESDTVLAALTGGAITQPFIGNVRHGLAKILPLTDVSPELLDSGAYARLGRVVRRLPADALDMLTQNVLGDDGRRIGSDGVVRTVAARQEEPEVVEPTLFPEPEEVDSFQPGAVAEGAGTELTGEGQQQDAQAEPQKATQDQTEPKAKDPVALLKEHGALSRLELEDLGAEGYAINLAERDGLIKRHALGKFVVVETVSEANDPDGATGSTSQPAPPSPQPPARQPEPREEKKPARPAISAQLGGELLTLSLVYMRGSMTGKVTVSAYIGKDPKAANRVLLEESQIVLPPALIEIADKEIASISKPRPHKAGDKYPGKRPVPPKQSTKKSAAKKSAKKAPAKRAAKKGAAKGSSKKSGARAAK